MKKLFAIALAVVMAISCMLACVSAEEIVAYDNPAGDPVGVDSPWVFFGSGSFWGDNADLDLTWAEIKPIIVEGGAKFVMVYGGTPNAGTTPKACFNFNTYGDPAAEINVPFDVVDNGDGTYTATVELDTLVDVWTASGMDLDHPDVAAFLVQPWVADFVLYSAKFVTGDDAAAVETPAEEVPAEETPVEDAPADETPVEDTPAEETPAETGLALAVVPMIVAMAAIAVSKKR